MRLFRQRRPVGTPLRTPVIRPERATFTSTSDGWWHYADACVQYTLRHSERRVGTDVLAAQGKKWLAEGEWGPAARCLGLAIEQLQSAALGGPYRAPDEVIDQGIVESYRTAMVMSLAEHPDFSSPLQADIEHKANLLDSIADRDHGAGYRRAANELRRMFVC